MTFIVFEGGEGSGKSTQARLLYEALQKQGTPCVLTREPGGTANAEMVRNIFIQGETWRKESELFLVMAARIEHWHDLIKPHLAQGHVVICDRFMLSTLAYQGYGHGLPIAWIQDLHHKFLPDAQPDITFILDLPSHASLARAKSRQTTDRFEQLDLDFHERVRKGFLALKGDAHVLDGAADVATIQQAVLCQSLQNMLH